MKYKRVGLEHLSGFSVVDLVPKENLQKWIKCLQAEFPVVAFKSSAQLRTTKVVGDAFYCTSQ